MDPLQVKQYMKQEETHTHGYAAQRLCPAGTRCCSSTKHNLEAACCHEDLSTAACSALCTGCKALFQPSQLLRCEKPAGAQRALAGQGCASRSWAWGSAGGNELGCAGLRLSWQAAMATRCDLAPP